MTARKYTAAELRGVVSEAYGLDVIAVLAEVPDEELDARTLQIAVFIDKINVWLASGKGVAVYENHDLTHQQYGHKRFFSFGPEGATFPDGHPPEKLPDFVGEINWRYWLIGTYQGEAL